jgi:hypothetical protein
MHDAGRTPLEPQGAIRRGRRLYLENRRLISFWPAIEPAPPSISRALSWRCISEAVRMLHRTLSRVWCQRSTCGNRQMRLDSRANRQQQAMEFFEKQVAAPECRPSRALRTEIFAECVHRRSQDARRWRGGKRIFVTLRGLSPPSGIGCYGLAESCVDDPCGRTRLTSRREVQPR